MVINDHSKIEEVNKKSDEYLKTHDDLRQKLANHLWAYNQMDVLIPQTLENFGSGHFFPYAESYYELENSLELCKLGFYRYALFALRCVLELAVLGMYFDKNDQAHLDIQGWVRSKEPTPYFQNILKRLFQLDYFHKFNLNYNLLQEIQEIYSSLSNYVHTRGYRYSTSGQTKSNFSQFNEKSLLQYINLMERTVRNITIMMLLKYPIGMQNLPTWEKFGYNIPMGGLPDESNRNAYLAILDEDTQAFLQKISDNDSSVKAIIKSINTLPDLTEDQVNQQLAEQDKWHEEHRKI